LSSNAAQAPGHPQQQQQQACQCLLHSPSMAQRAWMTSSSR
jgi:hypothetical protein